MNKKYSLSANTIKNNYDFLISYITKHLPSRKDKLIQLYEDLGAERIALAPASSTAHFHNAIPGGYVDHILRVIKFSIKEYQNFGELGLDVSDITKEEIIFSALNHDLGKIGFVGDYNELYQNNTSEWHKEKLGQIYKMNEHIPYMPIQDRSLYLLQKYEIPLSLNEWIAIRIHDGMYDEANKSYWVNYNLSGKLRSNLPLIIHNADIKASRLEFELWNKQTGEFRTSFNDNIKREVTSIIEDNKPNIEDTFNKLFNND